MPHDPRQQVEQLRDHLAARDQPIAFLLGAGTSCAVRDHRREPLVPAVAELGELCSQAVGALGSEFESAYATFVHEAKKGPQPNIEGVLNVVRRKVAAVGADDKLSGLDLQQLEEIERTIQKSIAKAASPGEDRIPQALPHHGLARWIKGTDRDCAVEIFTTNYDTLIERGLEEERVPAFDGFVGSRRPFFSPASLQREDMAPGRRWARLWKIHGSVNWQWDELQDKSIRIVRGAESQSGELILPSFHKYDESRKQPYLAILDRLHAVLTARASTLLFVCGYSFGDDHINAVLFDALDARDDLHVVALMHSEIPDEHELVKRARRRANLVVYGPETGIVGTVRAPWRLIDPVDESTAGLLDIPFDSDAMEDDDLPVTGQLRLGDFNRFCHFLGSLAAP